MTIRFADALVRALAGKVPVIEFVGAPFTLASYMSHPCGKCCKFSNWVNTSRILVGGPSSLGSQLQDLIHELCLPWACANIPKEVLDVSSPTTPLRRSDPDVSVSDGNEPSAASTASKPTNAAPPDDLAFASKEQRIAALTAYTALFQCSEAALARTANVDPADLSKWKNGFLRPSSDKKARIQRVLKNQAPPTPPSNATGIISSH